MIVIIFMYKFTYKFVFKFFLFTYTIYEEIGYLYYFNPPFFLSKIRTDRSRKFNGLDLVGTSIKRTSFFLVNLSTVPKLLFIVNELYTKK